MNVGELFLREVIILIRKTGRYNELGLLEQTLEIEHLLSTQKKTFPCRRIKCPSQRIGINSLRAKPKKERILSRQTVKKIFAHLDIKPFSEDDLISKWLNKGTTKGTQKANEKFIEFDKLRSNEVSIVMLNDHAAKVVIRKKNIDVRREDLGLTTSQWKLLESSCCNDGDVSQHLKNLNKSSDREKENSKIKTLISRTRTALKEKMGLEDDPIPYTKKGNWCFAFQSMQHKEILGTNVTKSSDAMDHTMTGQEEHLNEEDY